MKFLRRVARTTQLCTAILTLLLLFFPAGPAAAARGMQLRVYAGVFNTDAWINGTSGTETLEAGVEVLGGPIGNWNLAPLIGTTANIDEANWLYGGVRWDHWLEGPWLGAFSFAVTLYDEGHSKALGSDLEFRSAIEISRSVTSGHALGVQFYHISNAGIDDSNPGNNSVVLFYSVPFRG